MELKEIENKIGQLQYEISCLGLDKEYLTGVSIRTEELKDLVKKLTIPVVVKSFYCFEESMNMQLKCDSECDYCKAIKIE